MAFKTHDGGGKREPVERYACPYCEAHYEIAVRAELMQIWIGPDIDEDGKLSGGSPVWVCWRCLMRGQFSPAGS